MTLKDLISQYGWLNIEAALRYEYPAEEKYISCYEAVYNSLLLLPEADTDLQIEIRPVLLSDSNTNCVDVYGKRQTPHVAEADFRLGYALHFTPWAEWLAMPVSLRTSHTFSHTEIIAHCLHTMTLISFDENTITAECEKLSESIELLDHTSDDHWQHQAITWEQLLAQLNKEE